MVMEGIIANYRRAKHRQTPSHIIIKVASINDKEQAMKLIGKTVSWKNPIGKAGMEIKGKVAKEHGNSGAVRAIFERGLPGQAIGTKVNIA
ncbi:MAG: 50S ribosomal protein L35ae [Nanoarchaeota archaeon]|nr:50S ribosomal protein L35ae [Nanoarchaeota archaeon]